MKGEIFFKIGGLYYDAKRYSEAAEYIDRGLKIGFDHLDKIHISSYTLEIIVKSYMGSGRKDRALEVYNKFVQEKVIKENKKINKLLMID